MEGSHVKVTVCEGLFRKLLNFIYPQAIATLEVGLLLTEEDTLVCC